jgi:predicted DNA-binding WGR domain protein
MTPYLEYKDEKSAKFWKITVESNTHTVTYGKIGTDGQSKTKTFESAEKALQEAQKLIKAKTKKGYHTVAKEALDPPSITFIEEAEAIERFDFKKYDPLGRLRYDAIVVAEGDLSLNAIYDSTIAKDFFDGNRTTSKELIIIDGNLTLEQGMSISGDNGYPSILILGDLHCKELDSYDNVIHIEGNAYIQHIYYGNYNHGVIKITGTTHVPYLINSDHCSDLTPCDNAVLINVYNDEDDSFDYDYYSTDLGKVFLDHLVELEDEDEEDEELLEYHLDLGALVKCIKAGISPFKKGMAPKRKGACPICPPIAQ